MAASSAAVDRLSSLPDGIILGILSRLPLDYMVRAAVLSSRFRRLWTSTYVLDFTHFSQLSDRESFKETQDLVALIDRCLRQCSASPKLRSAKFPLLSDTVDRWIRFSAAGAVEDLALIPRDHHHDRRVDIPPSLFDCRLLASLKIGNASIPFVPPGFYRFPCLRTLTLTLVTIDNAAMDAVLSACPLLENLSLSEVCEITRLVIRFPGKLRHLMLNACDGLKRVVLGRSQELRSIIVDDASVFVGFKGVVGKMEEASLKLPWKLYLSDLRYWTGLANFISCVRVLHVNHWLFEFTAIQVAAALGVGRPIFGNLVELHWTVEEFSDSLRALALFLRDCPSLEQLCVLCPYYVENDHDDSHYYISGWSRPSDDDYDDDDMWQESKHNVLREFEGIGYLLPRLKKARLMEFSGMEEEMQLVKFLAEKAVVLESIHIYYVPEPDVRRGLKKMKRQLSSFRRTSLLAQILVSGEDETCRKHARI